MKKFLIAAAAAPLAFAAAPAMAQDAGQAQVYGGVTGGYHDVDAGAEGGIFGVVAGVDVPAGESLILGVEGNYNIGTADIDSEYGVAAKLGIRTANGGQLYVRGGYQEVNFDLGNLVGGPVPAGLDDTDGDYLVGVGGQFKVAENASIRLGVDTIAFDSTRATAGVLFHF